MSDREVLRARALAAPARRSILTWMGEADDATTVAQLTERLGINHTAVRKHLAVLVAAGLVDESREARTTRGRPQLLYRLAADTPAGEERSYRRVATMLATVLATGDDPVTVGRRAGEGTASAPGLDGLTARLAIDGFAPTVRKGGAGRTEVVLQTCPFVDAAEANPAVVCALHLGLAEATGETAGVEVTGLVPRPPRRAGCRLLVRDRQPAR